jgi:hypothetical protein
MKGSAVVSHALIRTATIRFLYLFFHQCACWPAPPHMRDRPARPFGMLPGLRLERKALRGFNKGAHWIHAYHDIGIYIDSHTFLNIDVLLEHI